jgi:hypothetical protein
MTASINFCRPHVVDSLIPIRSTCVGVHSSSWTVKNFKKAYTGVNCFLSWGERVSGPGRAPFYSEHRRALKLQSSAFTIPGWFQNAFQLSKDVMAVRSTKSAAERAKAIEKIALTSIDFTNATIDLVQCLDGIHFIDLECISPVLPRVLSGISSVGRLVLGVNSVYHKYIKPYARSGQTESLGLSMQLKTDKEAPWKILEVLRNILGFISAVLAAIALFCSVQISPYVLLAFSTFSFVSSLAIELHSNL